MSTPKQAESPAIYEALMEENHIAFLIHDVAQAFSNAYAELVKPLGLTRPQARVIAHVARYPGISQKDLAAILNVGTMSITGILDRMEEKDLIKRGMDPTDRRVRRVFLTPAAKDLIVGIQKTADLLTTTATASIPETDRQRMSNSLGTMKGNLSNLINELTR